MERILVIDDEKDMVDTIKDFLIARGYEVSIAMDGEEALKKYETDKPDIVICDIRMPKVDGYQFLKELRTGKQWVPVIIISALTEPANIFKAYDLEADYYLAKPLDLEEVLRAVQIISSLIPLRKK